MIPIGSHCPADFPHRAPSLWMQIKIHSGDPDRVGTPLASLPVAETPLGPPLRNQSDSNRPHSMGSRPMHHFYVRSSANCCRRQRPFRPCLNSASGSVWNHSPATRVFQTCGPKMSFSVHRASPLTAPGSFRHRILPLHTNLFTGKGLEFQIIADNFFQFFRRAAERPSIHHWHSTHNTDSHVL